MNRGSWALSKSRQAVNLSVLSMHFRSCLLLNLLLAIGSQSVRAQSTDSTKSVLAFGWSPAAGLLGIEWVDRSFSAAPRFGGAVGVGIAGAGIRLNMTLRDPTTHHRVPYLGVGYAVTPWMPVVKLRSVASIEGGVQFWPVSPHKMYVDVGTGIAFLSGVSNDVGPVLRLLLGSAF